MNTDHAATEPTPLDVDREAHTILHSSADQVVTAPDGSITGVLAPKWILLSLILVMLVVGFLANSSFSLEQLRPPVLAVLIVLVATAIGHRVVVKRRAARHLARESSPALSTRAWLSGTAHGWPHSFDAALWISSTGKDGPRIINSGLTPLEVVPDPDAHEEIDIAADLTRTMRQSRTAWIMLLIVLISVLPALLFWLRLPLKSASSATSVLLTSLVSLSLLHSFGWIPILRRVIIASPGRVEHTNFGRSLTFTRDDSVILLTLPNLGGWGNLVFLRNDRKHAAVPIRASNAPALNALLARWSYPALTSATPTPTHS